MSVSEINDDLIAKFEALAEENERMLEQLKAAGAVPYPSYAIKWGAADVNTLPPVFQVR
jgi:hypothetical protein